MAETTSQMESPFTGNQKCWMVKNESAMSQQIPIFIQTPFVILYKCNTAVNFGPGNGLLADDIKPLLDSKLSNTITSLTHWGRDKMAAVLQTTLSNAFF